MLGYVAWQFYGTNVVSARKQKQIVERTQQIWAAEPEVSVRARPVRHRERRRADPDPGASAATT